MKLIFKVREKLLIDHGLSLISSHTVHLANLHHIVCSRTVWYGRSGCVSLDTADETKSLTSVINYRQFTSVILLQNLPGSSTHSRVSSS